MSTVLFFWSPSWVGLKPLWSRSWLWLDPHLDVTFQSQNCSDLDCLGLDLSSIKVTTPMHVHLGVNVNIQVKKISEYGNMKINKFGWDFSFALVSFLCLDFVFVFSIILLLVFLLFHVIPLQPVSLILSFSLCLQHNLFSTEDIFNSLLRLASNRSGGVGGGRARKRQV